VNDIKRTKWNLRLNKAFIQTIIIIVIIIIMVIIIILLHTPWSRVLPEKLKRPELLKKFPAFYGTLRFITAFTRARHLSLS
jgi:hypothetical protein